MVNKIKVQQFPLIKKATLIGVLLKNPYEMILQKIPHAISEFAGVPLSRIFTRIFG